MQATWAKRSLWVPIKAQGIEGNQPSPLGCIPNSTETKTPLTCPSKTRCTSHSSIFASFPAEFSDHHLQYDSTGLILAPSRRFCVAHQRDLECHSHRNRSFSTFDVLHNSTDPIHMSCVPSMQCGHSDHTYFVASALIPSLSDRRFLFPCQWHLSEWPPVPSISSPGEGHRCFLMRS